MNDALLVLGSLVTALPLLPLVRRRVSRPTASQARQSDTLDWFRCTLADD